jgi:hypothetical protein
MLCLFGWCKASPCCCVATRVGWHILIACPKHVDVPGYAGCVLARLIVRVHQRDLAFSSKL